MKLTPAFLLAAMVATYSPVSIQGAHAETCRFSGTSSYDGHVTAQTTATLTPNLLTPDLLTPDLLTLDVTLTGTAHAWLADYTVLVQEQTTWRANELQSVAVNYRTLVDGQPRRQQWDVWTRTGAGLEAHRAQAKSAENFQKAHPGFARHWPRASFAQPWLPDYAAAAAIRRPDLDLPARAIPPGLRTPLALAFYWSRYLPRESSTAPVFLPGWKHDARIDAAIGPATPNPAPNLAAGADWRRWSAPLHHPSLDHALAAAWVSPDHYLLQLALEARSALGSGQAILRTEGCQGLQIAPTLTH